MTDEQDKKKEESERADKAEQKRQPVKRPAYPPVVRIIESHLDWGKKGEKLK